MGVVYRATDRLLQRQVAVKRVLAQTVVAGRQTQIWSHTQTSAVTSAQAESGEPAPNAIKAEKTTVNDVALANEFRFLASLRHPNIVSVLDFGFDDERHPYYGMDWLSQARTIFDVSRERDVAGRIELIVQVLHALVYLHRQGISSLRSEAQQHPRHERRRRQSAGLRDLGIPRWPRSPWPDPRKRGVHGARSHRGRPSRRGI